MNNLLCCRADEFKWRQVAADTNVLLRHPVSIRAKNGQALWMKAEVFAAPDNPNYLQAVFTDQTEIALLKGQHELY